MVKSASNASTAATQPSAEGNPKSQQPTTGKWNILPFHKIKKLLLRIKNIHPLLLVLLAYIAAIALNVITLLIYQELKLDTSNILKPNKEWLKKSLWATSFLSIILSPWFETIVFQHVIKKLLDMFNIMHWSFYIFISSALFGMAHGLDRAFFLAFNIGLMLGAVYKIRDRPQGNPFYYTWLLHSLNNGIAVGVTVYNL
jgi:membrane protease YdiL (CAAX protease family)